MLSTVRYKSNIEITIGTGGSIMDPVKQRRVRPNDYITPNRNNIISKIPHAMNP